VHDVRIRQGPTATLDRRGVVIVGYDGSRVTDHGIDLGIVLRRMRPETVFAYGELGLNVAHAHKTTAFVAMNGFHLIPPFDTLDKPKPVGYPESA
jgi:hypothetical protein